MTDTEIVTTYCKLYRARKGYTMVCNWGYNIPNTTLTNIKDIEPFMLSYFKTYGFTVKSTVYSENMETLTMYAVKK